MGADTQVNMSNLSARMGELPSSRLRCRRLPFQRTAELNRLGGRPMDEPTTPAITTRRWRAGPSWGVFALVLLALGVAALVAGIDAALYAEIGGREGPERAFSCTPQEDGSCFSPALLEQQAAREQKLMSKLNSVGSAVMSAGLLLFVAGLVSVGAALNARRRRREGSKAGAFAS